MPRWPALSKNWPVSTRASPLWAEGETPKGKLLLETKRKTGALLIFMRVLFTGCLVYSIWFIFQNSLQIAQASSERSQQVQEILNALVAKVGLGPFSLHTVRKLAHFAEFSLMGFWFMLCLRVYTRHFVRHVSWPLLCGLLVAVIDETIQLYVPGRSSSTLDVLLDFSGVCCGLFAALLILLFFRMCGILWRNRERDVE